MADQAFRPTIVPTDVSVELGGKVACGLAGGGLLFAHEGDVFYF